MENNKLTLTKMERKAKIKAIAFKTLGFKEVVFRNEFFEKYYDDKEASAISLSKFFKEQGYKVTLDLPCVEFVMTDDKGNEFEMGYNLDHYAVRVYFNN